ncbi:serine hydrolase [Blastopirellula sp. JC732]|uniref:beta-lactamase n=1 Tax=Blastopirellula sediminis TaxID=2894196 RepID=A0A9X1SFA2_9BACT|nr:serine hydrolase [Blastopirellula sediminis]MCC9609145.1 serine hydrolase [Blastopirellula sediminis]MCC9628078.1 serine hydrolase [Blastopirellula sediminis]
MTPQLRTPACLFLLLTFAVTSPLRAKPPEDPKQVEKELAETLLPAIKRHRGEAAVLLKHLPSGATFAYEADRPQATASLIKLPLLMALYKAVDEKQVSLDTLVEMKKEDQVPGSGILTGHFSPGLKLSVHDAAHLMITYSDNTATNLVIDQVGLPATRELMKELACPSTQLNSKVYRRDTSIDLASSQKYGLGVTSCRDMVHMLEMLHAGKFIDDATSKEIVAHLAFGDDKSKVTRYLPPGIKPAHKTGGVSDVRTDAGIIPLPEGVLLFSVLTQKNEDHSFGDKNEAELLAAEIGQVAYHYFADGTIAPPSPTTNTLALGAEGDLVESLQRTLNARMEPSPQLQVDGDFGPNTESALLRFQTAKGLTANGIVDKSVWKALGPLVTEDEAVADVATINSAVTEKTPADSLEGIPFVTAKAWTVVDFDSGVALGGENAETVRDPASVTKIMTAHLVLQLAEKSPEVLDEIVTFSERADKTPGSTSGLKAGEQVSVSELLYGLMLPSGNDASVAFAEHFGDRLSPDPEKKGHDGFVAAMNEKAKSLGMTKTGYANPHGLTAEGHVTTAADMAKLARAAMQSERFREIVATPQRATTVQSKSGYERNVLWRNTNQLLDQQGYFGVKTGTTGPAGACLVSCCERDGKQLLMVVLGSSSTEARYADTRNLYRWIWKQLADQSAQKSKAIGG